MHKRVAEAGSLDYRACRPIGFAPADRITRCDAMLHEVDGRVARLCDNREHPRVFGGNRVAGERDPGEVGIDTVGPCLFGPQIEQDEIAAANRTVVFRASGRSAGWRYAR